MLLGVLTILSVAAQQPNAADIVKEAFAKALNQGQELVKNW
jgi:hypothetical protein